MKYVNEGLPAWIEVDMRSIEIARATWQRYACDMRYLAVNDSHNDAEYEGCSVIWLCGTPYVYVEKDAYRVANPFTKDGKLRVRPTLFKAGVLYESI